MVLEIGGIAALDRFSSIWGWYPDGFKPQQHCQACFKGRPEQKVHKATTEQSIVLRDDVPYFYLCALGRPRSGMSNVHLVVKPQPGAVASVGSLYGVTFTIRDALAIRIKNLPQGWRGLDDSYTQCPNFQFAVQMFGYPLGDDGSDRDMGRALSVQKPLEAGEQ